MLHLRTLTYTTTKAKLASLEANPEFLEMTEVGALLNAIVHASETAPWQLATFVSDRRPDNETIYITNGLIYESILISKRLIDRYRDRYRDRFGTTYLLREYYETFTLYAVPEVVIGPSHSLPFGVHRRTRGLLLRVDPSNGCRDMLPLRHENEGFEFARVVPDDTFRKRGAIMDETLDTVLESAVEDFAYAAEDFIASTANRLGLTAATNPENGLGLAA